MTRLKVFGALTLIGMAATIIVQGGWQAAGAAFAIAAGVGFALTFAVIRAAGERPRSRHPSWAQTADGRLRRVAAKPHSERAGVSGTDTPHQPATAGGRPLAPRPARAA
jgi:hypothetical protein